MMKLFSAGVVASLLLPVLAACSSPAPTVVTDHDQQFDFSKARKIIIEPFNRVDPATITVTDGQIAGINAAIEAELRSKGFEIVTNNREADLYLTWFLVTEGDTDLAAMQGKSYYRAGAPAGKYVQGTLVVDMTDPLRNQPVWRSVIQSRLQARPDPATAEQNRRIAARAVFADFPPKQQ